MLYYVLVSEGGLEVRKVSKDLDLDSIDKLTGTEGEAVERIENQSHHSQHWKWLTIGKHTLTTIAQILFSIYQHQPHKRKNNEFLVLNIEEKGLQPRVK